MNYRLMSKNGKLVEKGLPESIAFYPVSGSSSLFGFYSNVTVVATGLQSFCCLATLCGVFCNMYMLIDNRKQLFFFFFLLLTPYKYARLGTTTHISNKVLLFKA